jgi:hypothetical protein
MPDFTCDLSQRPRAFDHFWEHTGNPHPYVDTALPG